MHTVQDENGNPVPHGHDQTENTANGADKQKALLHYMVDHNEHHAAELDDVAQKFLEDGQSDVAEQIRKAVDEYQKGNMYLKLALSMVKN